MIDFINFFYTYIESSIEILIMLYFFFKFLCTKINFAQYLIFSILNIIFIIFLLNSSIIQFCILILLLIIEGIYISKSKCMIVVLYALTTTEIMRLCYGVFDSLFIILSSKLYSISPQIASVVFMVFGSVMALLLSIFCYFIIYKYFIYDESIKSNYIFMILTPILMLFFISEYIYENLITIKNNSVNYQIFIIQVLAIFSLFCIMYAYKKLLATLSLNIKISLLEQETNLMKQYVEEAQMRYEKTKSFRHDIKNHIEIVKELLENNQIKQALTYISGIKNITTDISFVYNTNNPVLNVLLANKLSIAKSNNIDVSCSLCVPYPCEINDIDFCIILVNALDNAVEACKKLNKYDKKYIRISGNLQGDFLLIDIENSFLNHYTFKEGIGLKNIKMVAEKYNGVMKIQTQKNIFSLSVLLIIPHQL